MSVLSVDKHYNTAVCSARPGHFTFHSNKFDFSSPRQLICLHWCCCSELASLLEAVDGHSDQPCRSVVHPYQWFVNCNSGQPNVGALYCKVSSVILSAVFWICRMLTVTNQMCWYIVRSAQSYSQQCLAYAEC